jgi:hypothetical protein
MSERWLQVSEAIDVIRLRVEGSIGRAQGILKAARTSNEVRVIAGPVLLLADDGLVGMNLRPGAQHKVGIGPDGKPVTHTVPAIVPDTSTISEDDLLDWLDRQHPTAPAVASARYPGDAALIEEGRQMLARGKQKRAVARELAERAEGAGTFESKVDRLRRLL